MSPGRFDLDGDGAQSIHVGNDPQLEGQGLGTTVTAALVLGRSIGALRW